MSNSVRPHGLQDPRPPCPSPTSGVYSNSCPLSRWNEVKWSEVKWSRLVVLFATPWTVAYQAPQSMAFSRQEYRSGLPFPSPGDFLTQGSNLGLLHCRHKLYRLRYRYCDYWVSDAIQISHPQSSSSPPTFNLSQQQGLFKWVSTSH